MKPGTQSVVTDEVKAGALTGNLEVLVEPVIGQLTHPYSGQLAGGSLVLKYNLLSFGRWVPFWDAGGGMIWTHAHRIHEEGSPFNFILETGPGVQYFITARVTLTLGIRWAGRSSPVCHGSYRNTEPISLVRHEQVARSSAVT